MPTQSKLESALRNAHKAGDVEAAKKLANAIKASSAPAETQNMVPAPELPEMHRSGILGGEDRLKVAAVTPAIMTATDPNEIAKIVSSNFPNVSVTYNRRDDGEVFPILVNSKTGAATEINQPGISEFDILQTLGIGAALFPANRAASIAGAAAKSAVGQSAIQGVQAASGGQFDPEEVAIDAAIGGAGQGAENLISGATRIARGRGASDVVEAGKDAGIPVMTTDVRPPETFVGKQAQQAGESVPIIGTSGRRAAQQEARVAAVDDLIGDYPTFSYEEIVSSLKDQTGRVKRAAGNVLETTGQRLDTAGQIPLNNTQKAMQEAQRELSRPGVIQSGAAVDDLQKLMAALNEPQTFSTLKENRTVFRELLQGVDKAERSQLPSKAKATLERVAKAMSNDMDAFARQNLSADEFAKWQRANKVYAEHADTMRRSRLKNLLDAGDIKPEQVGTLLFSSKPSEQKLLYKSLTPKGRDHARAAIVQKVVSNLSRRQSGLTPNSFVTELKKHDSAIETFFKGAERDRLRGLQRVLEATTRAQDAAANPATGRQLIGYLIGGGVGAETVATGGFPALSATALGGTGIAARLYESPPVRDALLRLGSIPRDSDAFDRALRNATSALTSAAQAIVDEQSTDTAQ